MCEIIVAVIQAVICWFQVVTRLILSILLTIENIIRMILQALYNIISFVLQMLTILPICLVFILTSRLKCLVCGGGSPCVNPGSGDCDCIVILIVMLIIFFTLRATGYLDTLLDNFGYASRLNYYSDTETTEATSTTTTITTTTPTTSRTTISIIITLTSPYSASTNITNRSPSPNYRKICDEYGCYLARAPYSATESHTTKTNTSVLTARPTTEGDYSFFYRNATDDAASTDKDVLDDRQNLSTLWYYLV